MPSVLLLIATNSGLVSNLGLLLSELTVYVGREDISSSGDMIGGGVGGKIPGVGADFDGDIVSGGSGGRVGESAFGVLSLLVSFWLFWLSFSLFFFDLRTLRGVTGAVFSGGGTIRDRLSISDDGSREKNFCSRGSFLRRASIR